MRAYAVVLFALCLLALSFVPGVSGPFLLDDLTSVVPAKPVSGTVEEVFDIATRDKAGVLRRPISTLSFAANHAIARDGTAAFKLVNLALHIAVGVVVFAFLRAVFPLIAGFSPTRAKHAAFWTAALWLVHPIQVSTALYVVQRMAQLTALFTLAALLVFVRWFEKRDRAAPWSTLAWYGLLTILAIASKESGVLVPLFAAVILLTTPYRTTASQDRAFVGLAVVAPLVAGAAIFAALWPSIAAGFETRGFSQLDRLLTQGSVLFHYLWVVVYPDPANMGLFLDDFPLSRATDPRSWVAPLAWTAVALVAFGSRRRAPLFAFAVLWFLAGHAVESTVVALELAFEHRNYLALVGPIALAGAVLSRVHQHASPVVRGAPLALVLVLAGLTMSRAHDWSSVDRFYLTEYARHPDSPRALNAIAALMVQSNRPDEAAGLIARIQERIPDQTWPLVLDAHLLCAKAGHAVDWELIERRYATQPISAADFDMLTSLATRRATERPCANVPERALRQVLARAIERFERDEDTARVEKLLVAVARLDRADGELDDAIGQLQRAAQVNPRGTEALFQLAEVAADAGVRSVWNDALAELRERDRRLGLFIGYRIDALSERPLSR